MEQIKTQVSDLRYLAQQAPLGTGSISPPPAAHYPSSASPTIGGVRVGAGVALAPARHGSATLGDNSASAPSSASQLNPTETPPTGSAASIGISGDMDVEMDDEGDGDGDAMNGGAGGIAKRKAGGGEEGGSREKQTRSKRNRYISIACNECKRRKIKCNGQTPCQRCGNLNLACLYTPNCCAGNFKDTSEFKQINSQLSRLQDEVSWLQNTVKALQAENASRGSTVNDRSSTLPSSTVAPSPAHGVPNAQVALPRPDHHATYPHSSRAGAFKGATSMAYSLEVANSTISNMGLEGFEGTDDNGQVTDDTDSRPIDSPVDPLYEFDKDEMVRLCRLHEEEVGIMYPVLNIQDVIEHANYVASVVKSVPEHTRPYQPMNDNKTLRLKMVMCCALAVDEHGHSETAIRLYDSFEAVINRKLMADASDVADLPLLALLAGYRFLSNDEVLAWRVMGQVTRLCFELGIHQKRGLMRIQDEKDRKNALMSFWSAYVLDRRWAFSTGLPYCVQDEEIDPQLPWPDEYPYLIAMITYSQLGAKVWRQVSHFGPVLARELRHEEIERLDQEIVQWYETVPDEVKVRDGDKENVTTSTPSYNLQRLRIWTYLRLNQIRIWLHTPILHSATSIMTNPIMAQRVVDLAKDTIRYLSHLNHTTNLYRRIQVFYHQFLASAISVVFLASVHAPVRFSALCREEFYLALELVKDLSAKSWVSKRLWRTIRSLKDVAPTFGLNPDDDRHSSAALGMIGLARGGHGRGPNPVDRTPYTSQPPTGPVHSAPAPTAPAPTQHLPAAAGTTNRPQLDHNGSRIQSEMSRIFEGYVGLNGFQYGSGEEQLSHPNTEMASPDSAAGWHGDGTVFPHLREMF